jgi:Uma2 family endonuclease
MTVAIEKPAGFEPGEPVPPMLVLENVSWETYDALLRDLEAQRLRITYDEGRLVVMSPLPRHERVKSLMGSMVEVLAMELRIPISRLGSTTWRKRLLRKGLEADECYYVQNEPLVRARDEIDLKKDPPPDLAVEVEITHHPLDRLAIYAALGVPEIWYYTGKRVRTLRLEDAKYEDVEYSVAFPFLRPAELERFLEMRLSTDETTLMCDFRDWVRTLQKSA